MLFNRLLLMAFAALVCLGSYNGVNGQNWCQRRADIRNACLNQVCRPAKFNPRMVCYVTFHTYVYHWGQVRYRNYQAPACRCGYFKFLYGTTTTTEAPATTEAPVATTTLGFTVSSGSPIKVTTTLEQEQQEESSTVSNNQDQTIDEVGTVDPDQDQVTESPNAETSTECRDDDCEGVWETT